MKKRRFWPRKDRKNYFFGGVAAACAIASLVSTHWHRSDRLSVTANIRIVKKGMSRAAESRKLKEAQLYSPAPQQGAARRGQEENALIRIPDLKDDDDD